MNTRFLVLAIALLATEGCDRRVESFAPGEKPQTPELTKIFPAGADRAARPAAGMASMPGGAASPGRGAPPVEELPAPIEGTIELAPELAGSIPPNAVGFLMAHAEASGSLVAAQRVATQGFPIVFSIGSADHMMAPAQFSGPLRISVRIDTDGNAATRDAGDLLGSSVQSHQPGDRGVVVLISEVQTEGSTTAARPAAATAPTSAATGPDSEAIEMEPAAAAQPAAATVPTAAATGATAAAAGATAAAIEGTLELAPDLVGRVPPGAVLYVIARTAQGGPPLAVSRIANPSFPMRFSIGPENRMNQSMPFAGEMLITVRVDSDGNAMTRNPGDLQGASETPNVPGDRGITLLIDEVL
jgi:hypothetical protein